MGLGLGGNKPNKKNKNNKKEDLFKNQQAFSEEDDIFGEDDEFAEYDNEIKNRQQNSSSKNSLYNDENAIDNQEQKKGKKNIVLIVLGILMAIVVAFVVFNLAVSFFNSKQEAEKPVQKQPQVTITSDNDSSSENSSSANTTDKSTEEKKDVSAGIPDLNNNTKMTNTAKPTDPKEFMKDIKGDQIPKAYTVVRIETVTDFVNYTKKRAIMGDGVELYWLEATYKGQPYVITIPYQMFKELDDTGITVVNVEVLHLKDGHTVVSYMSVNPDAKRILQQAGKR